MLFVLQIAVGVCLGLLLFRAIAISLPAWGRRHEFTVRRGIGLCALATFMLWIVTIILTVYHSTNP